MKYLFQILLSSLTLSVIGQNDLRFKPIITNTGENIVGAQSFLKDREGYMWISSTTFGLVRFDGHSMRTFTASELQTRNFKSNRATLLFEDSKQNFWIGTDAGALLVYDRMMDSFLEVNDSTTRVKSRLFCQAEDADGSFWLGSLGSGLLRFHPDTKKFTTYQFKSNDAATIPDNFISGLAFDTAGTLWVSTTGGLCSYNPQKDNFIRHPLTNNNPDDTYRYRVIRNLLLSQDKLYLSTYGGLQIFDLKTYKSEHLIHDDQNANSLSHNSLFQTVKSGDGKFWLASYGGGLSLYDPATGKFMNWKKDESNPESLSSNNLFSLYLDSEGLLWVGAADNMACIHNTRAKKFYSLVHSPGKPAGISRGWAQSMLQENDSIFWLGLNGNGLNRVNIKTGVAEKYVHDPKNVFSLGHNSVVAIDQDAKKNIWVGLSGGGINRLDSARKKFVRYEWWPKNAINNNAVSALRVDRDGFIWVTTFRSGLNIYDPPKNKFKNINNDSLYKATGISLANVNAVFELDGNIWFNTQTSVALFDKKRNRFVLMSPEGQVTPSTRNSFFEMQPYSETEMLLLSDEELKMIRYSDPEHIEEKLILKRPPNDEVFESFVVDRAKIIWYITRNKLVRWNPQSDEKRVYDRSDGILSNDLNSLFQDDQGRIFISTLNGINWFSPTEIQDDTVQRKIVFTDLKIYNRSIRIQNPDSVLKYSLPAHISQVKQITLEHEHSFFSIEFNALEFMAPNKINYAYRLDGFDNEWIDVGNQNFASYTNLDAGEYTFNVKATNPDGFWGRSVSSITIIINPPFWQTWWFLSLAALFAAVVIYSIHRYRLSQSLKVERLRTKIASDLHDEVGSSLTKISIYSELIQNGLPEKENANYLQSIGSLSREVVSTMSDIVWSIDNSNDTLTELINRMKDFATEVLEAKGIDFEFALHKTEGNKVLDPILRQNIFLIFKEAVNNAIKHAGATLVKVSITTHPHFELRIEDNGVGLPKQPAHSGNGLRNMRRRAESIGGTLSFSTSSGTKITLVVR